VPTVASRVRSWWFLGSCAIVVAVSVVWGRHVQADPRVKLGAAPLVGRWHVRFGWSLIPAVLLAAAVVWWGPRLAARMRFAWLAASAAVAGCAFTLLLAASDGLGHVLDPVVHPTEYWANLATLPGASTMLHHYGTIQFLLPYSVHAKGHPPGFLLLLKALAAIGLGHPWAAGALSYVGVVVVVSAGLSTVRAVAGEAAARASAPFFVVAPYAVWMGTSADAFYAAVGAVGALLTVTGARTSGPLFRRAAFGVVGGVALGALLELTYGGAVYLAVPLIAGIGVALSSGPARSHLRAISEVLLAALVGIGAVFVAFALAGFWWGDGLRVTRTFYWWGTAQFRPAGYFVVGNVAAALIAVGPAVVVGLARLRNKRLWLLVGAGALCIVAADVSQYSKAEVERIWLLFFPWLLPAVAVLSRPRRWLAAQAALAVGLQVALVSKW